MRYLYKRKEQIAPSNVTIKGRDLKYILINSISGSVYLNGVVKIADPQKSVPNPIKRSFERNPIKILRKKSKNKGKLIRIPPS